MSNPLADVEDRKAWTDFGRQAIFVFQGAREEGASNKMAWDAVQAFFSGMFEGTARANNLVNKEDEDNS